ncbi:Polysaccharide deacetylase [Faunimonas pinastri]|uniref:Chitooligosaccharide deacetylase n=1 Tax=Faunimonas pinastri TaxID=1855383 RepID=A0A1H9NLC0_9HYPH|nr:polysaccharide deacetylase family protein [Faunimonas pinastri]SER36455.1 Polysaccharide deacetylase [Faunimonas pinastri]
METRHRLFWLALTGLGLVRAHRWLKIPGSSDFVVTLHHVRPAPPAGSFAPQTLLEITPEFLDRFIGDFKARGWQFVSVEEIITRPAAPAARRIAITLDDGFRDNMVHAWPVFRRHRAPFTIFVCTGFADADAEAPLWWEAAEAVIAKADAVPVPGEAPAGEMPSRSLPEKNAAFRAWSGWLMNLPEGERRRAIIDLAARHRVDLGALVRSLVMTWDEIREIAADPLCTIGAHTLTHPTLARLSREEATREMVVSADRIEAKTGARPIAIAFPYGSVGAAGEREAQLAAEAGFLASFTTRPGFIAATGTRHGLPRVSINGYFQRLHFLHALLNPGLWALKSRLRR